MSWEHLIAGLLANLITDRQEQKKKPAAYSSGSTSASLMRDATAERLFINARNKTIIANYQAIQCSWFDDFEEDHEILGILPYFINDEDKAILQYYYSRLEVYPNSFECRTALIHYLYKSILDYDQVYMISLLQNELLYLIDYAQPTTQQERMYQHLAMFISAELYFFDGEFAKALKRLYQVLDWEEIYDNVEEKDGIDFNGLGNLHEAVVVNIINIYALAGLHDKADEVRKIFNRVISNGRSHYSSMLANDKCGGYFHEYVQDSSDAFMARDSIQGYYTLSLDSYNENFFKESFLYLIREQAVYCIYFDFHQPKDIWIGEAKGLYDATIDTYPALFVRYRNPIINYRVAINRDLTEIMSI